MKHAHDFAASSLAALDVLDARAILEQLALSMTWPCQSSEVSASDHGYWILMSAAARLKGYTAGASTVLDYYMGAL